MAQVPVILSTAYFPPIQYYCKIVEYSTVIIESEESYFRQTYRNRCQIMSGNGVISLSIPVVKNENSRCIRDVAIDYSTAWQREHYQAIKSAYRKSAYYDFYMDDFALFFEKKEKFLLDLNHKIILTCNEIVGIERKFEQTDSFQKSYSATADFRYSINPKTQQQKEDRGFVAQTYYQVFSEKFGFVENLSVLDLIFNEGPLSLEILKRSIKLQ